MGRWLPARGAACWSSPQLSPCLSTGCPQWGKPVALPHFGCTANTSACLAEPVARLSPGSRKTERGPRPSAGAVLPPPPGEAPALDARANVRVAAGSGRRRRPQRFFHGYRYGSHLGRRRRPGQAGELYLDDRLAHRGRLPCLRGAGPWRLVASTSRLSARTRRVVAGSMTSSMYPRSAARYGLA